MTICATCDGTGRIHDPNNIDYDNAYTDHPTYCGGWIDCPACYCAECGESTGEVLEPLNPGDDDLCIDCRGARLMTCERCDHCGRYEPADEMVSIETRDDVFGWCAACCDKADQHENYLAEKAAGGDC